MKFLYWILILCFVFNILDAESQNHFIGKVVDEQGIPIEYATAFIKSYSCGTHSESDGQFDFKCSENITTADTLIISYLGYSSVKIPVDQYQKNAVYELVVSNFELDVIEIVKSRNIKLENHSFEYKIKNPYFFYQKDVETNYQLASRIKNADKVDGVISSINFRIGKAGISKIPIRLMFYDVDQDCNCPGQILHKKDIIVTIKKGRNKLSVREFFVEISKNDFYVVFEWLHQKNSDARKLDFSIGMIPYNSSDLLLEKEGDSNWRGIKNSSKSRILTKIEVEREIDN